MSVIQNYALYVLGVGLLLGLGLLAVSTGHVLFAELARPASPNVNWYWGVRAALWFVFGGVLLSTAAALARAAFVGRE